MLISDFYSKPLQGKLFRLFRNLVLNTDDCPTKNFEVALHKLKKSSSLTPIKKSTLQECVGNSARIKRGTIKDTESYNCIKPVSAKDMESCENDGKVGNHDMSPIIKMSAPRNEQKRTYLDVCKNITYKSTAGTDTRKIVYQQDPALLLKLRNVANSCKSKSK